VSAGSHAALAPCVLDGGGAAACLGPSTALRRCRAPHTPRVSPRKPARAAATAVARPDARTAGANFSLQLRSPCLSDMVEGVLDAEAAYEHWGLLHRLQRVLEVIDNAEAAGARARALVWMCVCDGRGAAWWCAAAPGARRRRAHRDVPTRRVPCPRRTRAHTCSRTRCPRARARRHQAPRAWRSCSHGCA
jgi:hypothetical protein